MIIAKEHAEFLTVTCLEWTHVLQEDRFKDIECESLLVKNTVKNTNKSKGVTADILAEARVPARPAGGYSLQPG